jgi:ketosteroid isomerase-like protein
MEHSFADVILREERTPYSVEDHETGKEEICALFRSMSEALSAGDFDRIQSRYAKDLVAFDCPPPLRYNSREGFVQSYKDNFIDQFTFPVNYQFHEEKIFVHGDLAVFHALVHVTGAFKIDQKTMESWLRQTSCLQRRAGDWIIVHEHISAPIGFNGKGMMDLPPDGMTQPH